jgi:DNA-binding transcriptional MerR regulator
MARAAGLWRIGELSRRVGLSAATLRAWEDRYGLLSPVRSEGNYRLYGEADEARVRRVLALMDRGLATAEAARTVLAEDAAPAATIQGLDELSARLLTALEGFDEPTAQATLDRLFGMVSVERALRGVVLPVLHEIGERWAAGAIGVAEEHYASNLLQTRLHALAAGWHAGTGPNAVLACVPGELHSIGLLCCGLGLRSRGWTVFHLGQDTPVEAIERTAERVNPRALVLSAATGERFEALVEHPPHVPRETVVAVAGRGATEAGAARIGARLLESDPLTAAETLTRELR